MRRFFCIIILFLVFNASQAFAFFSHNNQAIFENVCRNFADRLQVPYKSKDDLIKKVLNEYGLEFNEETKGLFFQIAAGVLDRCQTRGVISNVGHIADEIAVAFNGFIENAGVNLPKKKKKKSIFNKRNLALLFMGIVVTVGIVWTIKFALSKVRESVLVDAESRIEALTGQAITQQSEMTNRFEVNFGRVQEAQHKGMTRIIQGIRGWGNKIGADNERTAQAVKQMGKYIGRFEGRVGDMLRKPKARAWEDRAKSGLRQVGTAACGAGAGYVGGKVWNKFFPSSDSTEPLEFTGSIESTEARVKSFISEDQYGRSGLEFADPYPTLSDCRENYNSFVDRGNNSSWENGGSL